jgi:hypothetical protein
MLFHKNTKKTIKYVWGFFSVIIALSMVVAFSGFASLAGTSSTPPQTDVEVSTPPTSQDSGATTSDEVELVPMATPPTVEATTPTPQLDFSL